tara:strand:+ start:108 stop:305 length:198 start_codon:yes stop_codon:yes gene_type:complete
MPNKKIVWIKYKHTNRIYDKYYVNKKRIYIKQMMDIFPKFQQFKIEIRKQPDWIMDWEGMSINVI